MILFADRLTERSVSLALVNLNSKAQTTAQPVIAKTLWNNVIYVTAPCDDDHRPTEANEYSM